MTMSTMYNYNWQTILC